ncbi:MAG: SpoIVB peptidase S55 domain-containing protein [Thermoanaerobaculia bacterium]
MTIRKVLLLLAAFTVSAGVFAHAADTMPVSEIRKGMKGYGVTIFEGDKLERFGVEILGVLPNMGPGQDLILARVDNPVTDHSGVIAGMSGSPIYIEGRLIGALAYSWQFSKDPIAGITPIGEMLRLENGGARASSSGRSGLAAAAMIDALMDPQPAALEPLFAALQRPGMGNGALPISIPVSFGNFASDTLDRFGGLLEASGLMAVPAGSGGSGLSTIDSVTPFQPGDSIGAVLLSGDFSVAATGTVTHVDGDRIWAFGHPFLDMGTIDFPMAKSEVITVLPNVARSFKVATTGGVVGALRQDRAPGIMGIVGERAKTIKVELTMDGSRGQEKYEFDLARHPILSPLLLAMVADSVVAVGQRAAGERTVMLESEIDVEGIGSVRLRDGWAGAEARQAIPVYLAVISSYLMSNEFTDAPIEGIRIRLRHEDDLRMARVVSASVTAPLDGQISPGDRLTVRAQLKPFRGEAFTETFEVEVPRTARVGGAYLLISGGRVANRLDFSLVPPDPRNLNQVVKVVERLRASSDLTIGLYQPEDGAVSGGVFHPSLPPSMMTVLAGDSSNGSGTPVKVNASFRDSRPLDYIVDGAVKIDLQIRPAL